MSDDNLAEELDESMAETLKEIQSAEEPEVLEEKDNADELKPDTQEGDSGQETREREEGSEGHNRDSKGRFKSKDRQDSGEGVIEVSEESAEESTSEESGEQTSDLEEEIQEEIVDAGEAPPTWRTGARLKWKDVDPEIRDEIIKREADMFRGISQYKNDADYGRAVQQTVQPYMAMINAAGSTPAKAIGSMMDTYYRLTNADPQQKSHLLMQVAQQYGADMSVFKNDIDPEQANFQQQLQPLQNQIVQLQQNLRQRDNESRNFETSQAQNEIAAFHSAQEDGKPKYPHFEIVRTQMADQIEISESQGIQLSLEQAYENVCWAIPEIRQQMLLEQTTNGEEKRLQEVKDKTSKAKKADKVNLQQKGSYDETVNKPTGDVNDTLKETLREIKGRDDE